MSAATRKGHRARTAAIALVAGLFGLTSGCDAFFVCPVADDGKVALLPQLLSETGLYADIGADQIAPGVLRFRPQFVLWSDGADKRRFLEIPAGATIDTSNMDVWQFPVGTKIWKEFSRDGVALETRLLQRTGPGDTEWSALAYVWNAAGSDAVASPTGFIDAGGTSHNVPGAGECLGCHGGRASFVLGVSAVQLSFDNPTAGEVDLADLETLGLLSNPPSSPLVVPGNETQREALGYIHANCGHCHNQNRPGVDVAPCMDPNNDLDFWLTVDNLSSPQDTPTYQTAIGEVIEPGAPDKSELIDRIRTRQVFERMPPLGTEIVDEDAVALLREWIEAMP